MGGRMLPIGGMGCAGVRGTRRGACRAGRWLEWACVAEGVGQDTTRSITMGRMATAQAGPSLWAGAYTLLEVGLVWVTASKLHCLAA
jgi:hypothetical protein